MNGPWSTRAAMTATMSEPKAPPDGYKRSYEDQDGEGEQERQIQHSSDEEDAQGIGHRVHDRGAHIRTQRDPRDLTR